MRKMKKVLVEMPPPQMPPPPFQMGGGDARATSKHQALLQDYEDLVKETESMRETLQARKKLKLNLMAEVRFLRRKFKSLLKNSPNNTSHISKTHENHCNPPSMETCSRRSLPPKFNIQSQNLDNAKQLQLVKERSLREKESAQQRRPLVLDLNQASLPNEEEELQVGWEPVKLEKPVKWIPLEADPVSSDLRLSLCRDSGNGTTRAGKRKISWLDPVALRV